jgi:hypothetical protein
MHKKLIMPFMAVAAFAAFVVAPAASASPALTSEGKTVPVGTSIVWLHTGQPTITGSVQITCSELRLASVITVNNGTQIKGEVPVGSAKYSGTGTGGDCTSNLFASPAAVTVNSKLCFETVSKTDNIAITGCGANISFTINITGSGPCKYSSAKNTATFRTGDEDATFTVLDQVDTEVEGGFFCPSSVKTDYDLDAVTTDGTTVTIS